MTDASQRPREEQLPPPDAGDEARERILAVSELRVEHVWEDRKLVAARLRDSEGDVVVTVDRVVPLKPDARGIWILGDVKSARYYIRTPEGEILWEVLRKPHFGGVKADMAPIPGLEVVRAVRGMPWTRNDFQLKAKKNVKLGTVRYAGGLMAVRRKVVDSAGTPFLETFDHGKGPWADYSFRWTGEAIDPHRTVGWIATATLNTALTKTRN